MMLTMCAFAFLSCNGTNNPTPNGNLSTKASQGLLFVLDQNTDTYILSEIGTCTDKEIIVPSTYNGKSVTSIRDGAFSGCSDFTSISLPDSITDIGIYTFSNCTALTSVKLPSGLTSIGDSVFSLCSSLTDITIPDSVTKIESTAFSGCKSLASIAIPAGVKLIDHYAFCDCFNLTDINYSGTIEDWLNIEKNSNWNYGLNDYTVHCTDGSIFYQGITENS